MRRGNLITVALSGDWGKPRPALVIQSDTFDAGESILVCLITSDLYQSYGYRLDIEANSLTSLQRPSQIQIDKIMAVRRDKCGAAFGQVHQGTMTDLDARLVAMLGIGQPSGSAI